MTKKDLFRIIIKLFGVYALISFITTTLSQLIYLPSFFDDDPVIIAWIAFAILLFTAFIILIIFYPSKIINWFKLDKGYDNDDANIGNTGLESLIKIAIIISGALFILNSFAPILVEIGYLLPSVIGRGEIAGITDNMQKDSFYINLVNLAIGYLLLTNYATIARFLYKKDTSSSNEKE
ncbi:MAG: hypothetical protein E6772_02095 [Dysgonomonas sp.]|nr:hypothetical protein [Dysgonomonas sp.]